MNELGELDLYLVLGMGDVRVWRVCTYVCCGEDFWEKVTSILDVVAGVECIYISENTVVV